MSVVLPGRGEIWLVDLEPVKGREQGGKRPALVASVSTFNRGPAGLVVILPLSTRERGIPWHVEVLPPEGGLPRRSFVKCEDIRAVSRERLSRRLGSVAPATIAAVEDRLRILLEL